MKVLVCLSKDLKRSFLSSHINHFKELASCFLVCLFVCFFYFWSLFLFFFFFFNNNLFYIFSTRNLLFILYRFSGSLYSISLRLLYGLPCQCLYFLSKSPRQLLILFTVNVCIILCITLYVCLYISFKVFLAK